MAELPIPAQPSHKSPATDASREKSRQVSRSIRNTLHQATKLKDLSFYAALEMMDGFESDEAAERSRAKAQAITALTKSWAEACDVVRITRGKPLPGSRRPAPEPTKTKKPTGFTPPSES